MFIMTNGTKQVKVVPTASGVVVNNGTVTRKYSTVEVAVAKLESIGYTKANTVSHMGHTVTVKESVVVDSAEPKTETVVITRKATTMIFTTTNTTTTYTRVEGGIVTKRSTMHKAFAANITRTCLNNGYIHFTAKERQHANTCPKCSGTGTTEFKHNFSGTCFNCGGTGILPTHPMSNTQDPTHTNPVKELVESNAIKYASTDANPFGDDWPF